MNYVNRSADGTSVATNVSRVIGTLLSANLNSTADQTITIIGASKYVIRKIIVTNASTSLAVSVAAGGFYTGAGKAGTTVVAAGQLYTALTANTKFSDMTLALTTDTLNSTALFFSLSVAHGGVATADIYIIADVLA